MVAFDRNKICWADFKRKSKLASWRKIQESQHPNQWIIIIFGGGFIANLCWRQTDCAKHRWHPSNLTSSCLEISVWHTMTMPQDMFNLTLASHSRADDLFMQLPHIFLGHFRFNSSPTRNNFFDPDAVKRRGGHFRAFGVLIDFHTSLVIKSCVRFLTLKGVLLENLPWPG